MLNSGTRIPITSLQYFADLVEEVIESAIPESYWNRFAGRWSAWNNSGRTSSSQALKPQPWAVSGCPTSPNAVHMERNPHSWHAGKRETK